MKNKKVNKLNHFLTLPYKSFNFMNKIFKNYLMRKLAIFNLIKIKLKINKKTEKN